jgi:hypothetical protein
MRRLRQQPEMQRQKYRKRNPEMRWIANAHQPA